MPHGALLDTLLGPLGHNALAGRHPGDVLERGVIIDADGVALCVWAPDPQLVLESALEDPVMVLQPLLLLGPCLSEDTGQLRGGPSWAGRELQAGETLPPLARGPGPLPLGCSS